MDFNEKTVKSEYIYKGKILNLRKDDIVLPDGKPAIREIVEHSGGSCVLCEKDGKVFMVKQFRYPFKKVLLELPAGKLNDGEDPLETAKRELKEEAGIVAEKLEKIFEIYPSTGYTEEKIYIYRAVGNLVEESNLLDEDEFLSGEWYDKKILKEMVEKGEIKDAKTLVALLFAFNQRK